MKNYKYFDKCTLLFSKTLILEVIKWDVKIQIFLIS